MTTSPAIASRCRWKAHQTRRACEGAAGFGAGAVGAGGAIALRPNAGTPRVVVVDDEPAIRIFLDKALRETGFDPIVVED